MKTSLEHLPERKQWELRHIAELIRESAPAQMIILFGSYARGDWVEELAADDKTYQYQSDFDLLVLVETRKTSEQERLEREIETQLSHDNSVKTPVSIIVHDIEFVNRRLNKGQYFFSDIKREGVLLYDAGGYALAEPKELSPKELSPKERATLAEEDFSYWFAKAESFLTDFGNALDRQDYQQAAFYLHQATERLYGTILLVFSRYKPNTHDLGELRKFVGALDQRLIPVFPHASEEDKHLFQLLRKAYVEARYKPSYRITHDELLWLHDQVEKLRELTETLCREKIASFIQA